MKSLTLEEAETLYRKPVEELQEKAMKVRLEKHGKKIKFYRNPFTPVSVTKEECELDCKHCNRHYLKHMVQVDNGQDLVKVASLLSESGVKGLVLSGGSRTDGSVPVYEFKEDVLKLKKDTGLRINAHTGVLTEKQAKEFAVFLDSAVTDVIGDRETVKEILGLDYGAEDYHRTLKYLRKYGVRNISPHVIVGLHYGKIRGELKALELLDDVDPENIVIVVFIPTKGTMMEKNNPPEIEDVAKIISIARLMYPEKEISLSCVRPGGRYRLKLDEEAIKSGLTKVVLPSKSAYETAERLGLDVEEINESRCCSW